LLDGFNRHDFDSNRETTGTLRGRNSLVSGRESDIRPEILAADDTEITFVLTVPQRDPSQEPSIEPPLESPYFENNKGPDGEDDVEELEEVDDGAEPQSSPKGLSGDISMQDMTQQDLYGADAQQKRVVRKKKLKISKHGIQYPSLPPGVVKKLATSFARTAGSSKAKISKETLDAIMQASDWFFEQVSDDLGAYAKHAGRKTIDESDIVTLMARYVEHFAHYFDGISDFNLHLYRQRQTNATTTPFSLAQRYLPRELLQELRMVPPSKLKKGRQLERINEAEED
jgi:histone H3/H4